MTSPVKTYMLELKDENSSARLVPHEFGGWVSLEDYRKLEEQKQKAEQALVDNLTVNGWGKIQERMQKLMPYARHLETCNLWHDVGGVVRNIEREGFTWSCNCGLEEIKYTRKAAGNDGK